RAAGIRIIMITGDYGLTAEAVARQVGLVPPGTAHVVDGSHLEGLSEQDVQQTLSSGPVIVARATPEHKLRIVRALQAHGEVVAGTRPAAAVPAGAGRAVS